jgi:hypothetical protein
MSDEVVTFDQCLKVLESFLEDITGDKEADVEKAEKYLERLKEIHNKLRMFYHEEQLRNKYLLEILKSPIREPPTAPTTIETTNANLEEMTFDYCLKVLEDLLKAVKDDGELNVVRAKKCLTRLEEIHDNLNSHYNAGKELVDCEESGKIRVFIPIR